MTTVQYRDVHNLVLPAHPNHTHLLRSLDNSNGSLPYLSREPKARFSLPMELLWSKGLNVLNLLDNLEILDGWRVMEAYCDNLLGAELPALLRPAAFDVAVVDLIYNECGLALAHQLGIPALGYWAFSLAGGEQEFTTAPANPAFVPGFMSKLTSRMGVLDRTKNLLLKTFNRVLMTVHTNFITSCIHKHYNSSPHAAQLIGKLFKHLKTFHAK